MLLESDCCFPPSTSPRRVESGIGPLSRILVGPLRIFRRFLIEVEHRPNVAERQRVVPQLVRFSRPQHQQGSRYLAFSREVRYSATVSTQTQGRHCQVSPEVPTLEARLRLKCQDQVDLFAKYQKVQCHKLTRTQVLDRSGKGF